MKKILFGLILLSQVSYGADFSVQFQAEDNSVSTLKIQDGAVTSSKIANGSIDDSKVSSLSSSKISDLGITISSALNSHAVPMAAYNTSTTAFNTTAANENDVVFSNVEFDDLNMYNPLTGIGVIPKSGKYLIEAQTVFSSTSDQANRYTRLAVQKNGTIVATNQEYFAVTGAENRYGRIRKVVKFNQGDTFKISISASHQQGVKSLNGNSLTNYFSIIYVSP